jgi:type I restriction enzyme S subunit
MAKTKSVPELRFKGFTDEWEERILGEKIDISSAARVHKEEWTNEGVPFFRSSDVVAAFKGDVNTKAFISHELYKKLSAISGCVQSNDILVTGGGSIGIPYLVKDNEPLYFKDADLLLFKNSLTINCEYLYTFLTTDIFCDYVKNITHIGTISHYTIEQAKSTPIKIPQIKEQTKIGSFFLNLDGLIVLHQRKHDKLLTVKKAMLEKMFPKEGADVPEIRFTGFTGKWVKRKLWEITDVLDGDRGKNYPNEFLEKGHTLFLSATNVTKNGFIFERNQYITEEKSNSMGNGKLVIDDIVLTSRGSIGNIAWYNEAAKKQVPFARINSGMLILRSTKMVMPCFITQFLKSPLGNNQIDFISFGSAQPQLTKKDVSSYIVSFPQDCAEQNLIATLLQHLDSLISLHQRELDKLKNIKKACLEKMFV